MIYRVFYAIIGKRKPDLPFHPDTPCLQQPGHSFWLGCCGRVGVRWGLAVAMAWAIGVMGSRLLLGMHWPLDLMVATVMSWIMATLGVLAATAASAGLLEKET
ncbi:Phosphatidylglycerophosphatase B [Kluyvera cryocrescens]|uniref:Phosphatidylglycerophosphatase B n=1 Tax=Kluyvera cryocrescens TaxID=580 RepID=A0A485A5A3_KLUCR|nr:Phosphatidylglycerophosphatase B [Kluyvera cryocrescens]